MPLAGIAAVFAILSGQVHAPTAPAGREAFAACPGSDAVLGHAARLSWEPQPSMAPQHRALRARLHLDFPESGTRLTFWSHAAHLGYVDFTVVATRDDAGTWHLDVGGEQGLGADGSVVPIPHRTRDLSIEDSRALDSLVANDCLAAAPTDIIGAMPPWGAYQSLEIFLPHRHVLVAWTGMRTAEEEQLVQLIGRD